MLGGVWCQVHSRDRKRMTALSHAATSGQLEPTRYLHHKGCDLDSKDSEGDTVFMHAVSNGHVLVAEECLDRGANLLTIGRKGHTALFRAISKGHAGMVRMLLHRGCHVIVADTTRGRISLMRAVRTRGGSNTGTASLGVSTGRRPMSTTRSIDDTKISESPQP